MDGLYRLLDSPELNGARRDRLLQLSAEVRTLAEAQRAQVATALRASRQKNAKLAEAQGSIEQLTAENQTLRAEVDGEREPQPLAAKQSRRRARR